MEAKDDSTDDPTETSAERPDLEDLWSLAEDTIVLPRMSFELDVTMTIPGATAPVIARRTGQFDDDTLTGVGTRWFETDDPILKELFELSSEIRIVGQVVWFKVSDGVDEDWGGFDLAEYSQYLGGDVSGSVDGDLILGAIVSAATEVVSIETGGDGATEWVVLVRADDLVEVVAAAGPAARLISAGAGSSEIIEEARIKQNADGHVTAVSINLDEWWTNALGVVDPDLESSGATMDVFLTLTQFEEPLHPVPPCDNPVPEIDGDGLTVLKCA